MKRFLILAHTAPLSADFSLDDLPGGAGRIDVLCRAVGASFFLSHGIRREVETFLLIQNHILIRIEGSRVRYLNPDERSTAALLRKAIAACPAEEETPEIRTTPGIHASRANLPQAIARLRAVGGQPIRLHEAGEPVDTFAFPSDPVFILSDHMEFAAEDVDALQDVPSVSLGATALHTSQCITILHYLLDQREVPHAA